MRLALLPLLLALAPATPAQSLADYQKLRAAHGVSGPATANVIDSLLGQRAIELKGKVKGTFRVGEQGAIMLERPGGSVLVVDCDAVPSWLVGNEVAARLLVVASRESEGQELSARLLAAVPEADFAAAEQKASARAAANSRTPGLSGPIGRLAARPAAKKDLVLPASQVTPIYASFIKRVNPRLTNAEAHEIAVGIVGFSLRYGVDARLIMAMVMVESGFNPHATSRAGAQGLGQLMPGTAAGLGVTDAYDKLQNLYGTVRLVRSHLDKYKRQTGQDFDSLVLALAAYNAGSGAVRRHGGVPPYRETQNYVRKVILTYYRLAGRA